MAAQYTNNSVMSDGSNYLDAIPGNYPPTPSNESVRTATTNQLDVLSEEIQVRAIASQTTPSLAPEAADPTVNLRSTTPGYPGYFPVLKREPDSESSSQYSHETATPGQQPRKDYAAADTKFPLLFPSPLLEQPNAKVDHHQPVDDFPRDVRPEASAATTPHHEPRQVPVMFAMPVNGSREAVSEAGELHRASSQQAFNGQTTPRGDHDAEHDERLNPNIILLPADYQDRAPADRSTFGYGSVREPSPQPSAQPTPQTEREEVLDTAAHTSLPPPTPHEQTREPVMAYHNESHAPSNEQVLDEAVHTKLPAPTPGERLEQATFVALPAPTPGERQPSYEQMPADYQGNGTRALEEKPRYDNDEKQPGYGEKEVRPEASRLNTLHRQELAMIPVLGAGAAASQEPRMPHFQPSHDYDQQSYPSQAYQQQQNYGQAQPQYGQVQARQPNLVSPQPGYIHPWDRRHPSNQTMQPQSQDFQNQGEDHTMRNVGLAGVAVPAAFMASTGMRDDSKERPRSALINPGQSQQENYDPPQATFMKHPQPLYPAQSQIALMDRSASRGTAAGRPESVRREQILDSMIGVPDPTYEYQTASPGRRGVVVADAGVPSRSQTPAHFYRQEGDQSVERSKSVRSNRTSGTARESAALMDPANRPLRLKRRNTLPENPLYFHPKYPSGKKKSGFFSFFSLPENPLWNRQPKRTRLPESPFLRAKSTRSSRSYSESAAAPSRRYSTASKMSRRQSMLPNSPWSPAPSGHSPSRKSTVKRVDNDVPRRTSTLMSRRLSQHRKSQLVNEVPRDEETAGEGEGQVVQHSVEVVESRSARASTAGIRSRSGSLAPEEKANLPPPVDTMKDQARPVSAPGTRSRPHSILKRADNNTPRMPYDEPQAEEGYEHNTPRSSTPRQPYPQHPAALQPTYSYTAQERMPVHRNESAYNNHAMAT